MVALQGSIARMTGGNSFKSSGYWSRGFHPPTGPPVMGSDPTGMGAGMGDRRLQDRASTADQLHQARASMVSSQQECRSLAWWKWRSPWTSSGWQSWPEAS